VKEIVDDQTGHLGRIVYTICQFAVNFDPQLVFVVDAAAAVEVGSAPHIAVAAAESAAVVVEAVVDLLLVVVVAADLQLVVVVAAAEVHATCCWCCCRGLC
jgi:hypothetical protein